MEKNLKVNSGNIREFFSNGFESAYDHNIVQIIQKFVQESVELCEKMLDDTRGNVVNDSNFDELLNFSSKSFSEMQRMYGLKYDSFHIQPLEYSTNNIVIGIDPIIPGNTPIKHIYKVDGGIKIQKKIDGSIYSMLKTYKAFEFSEINELKSKIMSSLNIGGYDQVIVPMSYCIPMEDTYEPNDPSPMYKQGILNVYTHLDKDDLYRLLTSIVFTNSNINDDFLNVIDTSSCKSFFRSTIACLLIKFNKSDIITTILNDCRFEQLVKNIVCKSTFGSISRYYDTMSTYGVRGFIVNEFKRIIKTRKTSENWNNRLVSSKNPVDVIFGSRGMDSIFNNTIADILSKKLYDKPTNTNDAIFEFLISNSFTYIIASGSLCIGEGVCVVGMNNLIDELPEDFNIRYQYIDEIAPEYYKNNENIIASLVALMYGTFMIKHIYDIHKRISTTSTFSSKEYDYFQGMLESGMSLVENNLDSIRDLVGNFIINYQNKSEEGDSLYPPLLNKELCEDDQGIDEIINPNGIFNHLDNVICRLLTMPTLLRICRNIRGLNRQMWTIHNKAIKNPVYGDSRESEKWVYGKLFLKSTENSITKFVGDCRIGGNVQNFCNKLIVDSTIAVECEDDGLISDCIRRTIVLNDLQYKDASDLDNNFAKDTLIKVAEIMKIVE